MRIIIVGSGIAGILLAELLKEYRPTIIATSHESAPPTALFHPFPGRSVQPHPLLTSAVSAAVQRYQQWHHQFPHLCRPITMCRPLVGAGGKRLLNSAQKYASFYRDSEIELRVDHLSQVRESLSFRTGIGPKSVMYEPAFAIDTQVLIQKRLAQLKQLGCQIQSDRLLRIHPQSIELNAGAQMTFDHLFLAIGAQLSHFFPTIKTQIEGGSLMHSPGLKHHNALSINGLHFTPNARGESVIGSTRWSGEAPSVSHCQNDLIERSHALLNLLHPLQAGELWRGLRCIYPQDRLPICGQAPENNQVSILGALGNKGLLWGPFAAQCLVNHVLHNKAIPEALSLKRTQNCPS